MDAKTWDSQPFWAQRIYREGLEWERPWDVKPSSDPRTWWTPLATVWENFGDIERKADGEDRPVREQKPDITAAGFKLNVKKGKPGQG